ncbi:MAG: 30S ribosomal protein S6 [Clostridia bacterium]|nr:MAG: 30S ribosomal protein S6 [Clostridia bacterium]
MRTYEVLYVLRPDLGEEATAAAMARLAEVITSHGGEVLKTQPWGKRRLAYEIAKYREGYYVLVLFAGEQAVSQELERVLKLSEEVIRYLMLRKEDRKEAGEEETNAATEEKAANE